MAAITGLLALTCAAGFVFWKGGAAERGGMALICVSWLGMLAAQAMMHEVVPDIPFFLSDVALAIGFLFLAVRFGSLWLGLAMLLQASLFGLHLLRFEDEFVHRRLYLTCVNALSYCVLLVIVVGAWASARQRVRLGSATSAAVTPRAALGLN